MRFSCTPGRIPSPVMQRLDTAQSARGTIPRRCRSCRAGRTRSGRTIQPGNERRSRPCAGGRCGVDAVALGSRDVREARQLGRIRRPGVDRVEPGPRRVLPLGFGRQREAEPAKDLVAVEPADLLDRVPQVDGTRQGAARVAGVVRARVHSRRAQPLGLRDLVLADEVRVELDVVHRSLVVPAERVVVRGAGVVRLTAHRERPARHQDEDQTGVGRHVEAAVRAAFRPRVRLRLPDQELLERRLRVRPERDQSDLNRELERGVERIRRDAIDRRGPLGRAIIDRLRSGAPRELEPSGYVDDRARLGVRERAVARRRAAPARRAGTACRRRHRSSS